MLEVEELVLADRPYAKKKKHDGPFFKTGAINFFSALHLNEFIE